MDHKTPREVLQQFYNDNNLGDDGGASRSSVRIEFFNQFHFYFPNFDARRKALIKHDIHHLIAGYATDLAAECEISAWEIASGCKKYWAAFLIDSSAIPLGILINFSGVLKAFSRGRRTKNLYHDAFSDEEAMDMTIAELRTHLLLDDKDTIIKPTFTDVIQFSLFTVFSFLYSILIVAFLPLLIVYSVFIEIKSKVK